MQIELGKKSKHMVWADKLLKVSSQDPDEKRRQVILNFLLIGISAIILVALLAVFIVHSLDRLPTDQAREIYLTGAYSLVGMIIVYAINRYGSGILAGSLFLIFVTLIVFWSSDPFQAVWGRNMIMLAIPVLMGSVIVHPNASFFMAGFVGILFVIAAAFEPFEPNIVGIFGYFAIALVSWLSSRNLRRALMDVRNTNSLLDERVAQRTRELQSTNDILAQRTQQLQATNARLQQEILERQKAVDALEVARDQALEASRLKSELLARTSHELRTPLGAILGFAEMLRAGIYGPIDERQLDPINRIIETNKGLTELVSELLDQAQLEAGRLRIQSSLFSPRELATEIQTRMGVLARNKGLKLSCEVSADTPDKLYGDVPRLKQILTNLVGNAIKFTQRGEVSIKIFRPYEKQWVLQVCDTGPGIPPEARTYIFEAFRQVDGSVTREHEGFGLGLSIVKQLATLMRGKVHVESTVGEGSCFKVVLPLILERVASSEEHTYE